MEVYECLKCCWSENLIQIPHVYEEQKLKMCEYNVYILSLLLFRSQVLYRTCISLSVYLSIYLSICLSIYLPVSMSLSFEHKVYNFLHLRDIDLTSVALSQDNYKICNVFHLHKFVESYEHFQFIDFTLSLQIHQQTQIAQYPYEYQ